MTAVAIVLAVVFLASPARAQEASGQDDRVERAQQLFAAGREALRAERPEQARQLLEESLELAPNAGTAFNLGVANWATGRPTTAHRLFEELLGGGYGPLADEQRREVQSLDEQARAAIARLRIRISGVAEARVTVDDELRTTLPEDRPWEVELDPGSHHIEATATGRPDESIELELDAGETRDLLLTLISTPTPDDLVEDPVEEDSSSVFESPWFWVTVAAVLAAGAAVVIFLATEDNTSDGPLEDDVFGVTGTLLRF